MKSNIIRGIRPCLQQNFILEAAVALKFIIWISFGIFQIKFQNNIGCELSPNWVYWQKLPSGNLEDLTKSICKSAWAYEQWHLLSHDLNSNFRVPLSWQSQNVKAFLIPHSPSVVGNGQLIFRCHEQSRVTVFLI